MRASRRSMPWVRFAADACRRVAAPARKAGLSCLPTPWLLDVCDGTLFGRHWIKRRDRSNIAVRQRLVVYLLQPLQQPPPLIAGARPRGAGAGSTLGACLRLRPNDSPPLKESCLSDGCEASPFFEIEARPLGVASSRRRPPAHSALVQLVLCFKSHCGRLLSSCGRPGE